VLQHGSLYTTGAPPEFFLPKVTEMTRESKNLETLRRVITESNRNSYHIVQLLHGHAVLIGLAFADTLPEAVNLIMFFKTNEHEE
jgi:hypothetical protein